MQTDEPDEPTYTPEEQRELQWLRNIQWRDQQVGRAIAEHVAAEREACAQVVVEVMAQCAAICDIAAYSAAANILHRIRARGIVTPDPRGGAGEESKGT